MNTDLPSAPRILVIHGPNLNLLGTREPEIYGRRTLAEIDRNLVDTGRQLGMAVETFQSNHEGALVDRIQQAMGTSSAVIINAAAYTHTSIAIRDALAAQAVPVVEVHLSNIYRREEFRRHSVLAAVTTGQIVGLGAAGYTLALQAVAGILGLTGTTA